MNLFILIAFLVLISIFSAIIDEQKKKKRKKIKNSKTLQKNDKNEIGKIGETNIIDLIESNIKVYKHIITNCYFYKDGERTEVDIILITCFGIYVIESKNFSGTIYGKYIDFKWTQWFPSGTHTFYNPIKQNEYHIEFMQHNLKSDFRNFRSYVVFGDKADIQHIDLSGNRSTKVINSNQLIETLITDMHNGDTVLSHEEIDKMFIDLEYFYSHLER